MKDDSKSLEDIFNLLDTWRVFPKYALERRADLFFALFIQDILQNTFPDDDFGKSCVLPEFPLDDGRIIKDKYHFYTSNIDYAVFIEHKLFLVELKTCIDSIDDKQKDFYTRFLGVEYSLLIGFANNLWLRNKNDNKFTSLKKRIDCISTHFPCRKKIEEYKLLARKRKVKRTDFISPQNRY